MQMRQMYDKDIERDGVADGVADGDADGDGDGDADGYGNANGKIEELWTRGIYPAAGQCCSWNLLSQISCSGR